MTGSNGVMVALDGLSKHFGAEKAVNDVSLAVAQDSREFATQRTPQRFGSLNLHFDFF